MDLKDILESKDKQMVFNTVLEEACRQWCEFISDAPERMDGKGFADFFYEIFREKGNEYIQEAKEEAAEKPDEPKERESVTEKLKRAKIQSASCAALEIKNNKKAEKVLADR